MTPETTSTGLGESLRNRRRQKNYTLEMVSQETRISTRFLRALEEEKWQEFPAKVYMEGFLKKYAQFLALDGDDRPHDRVVGRFRRRRHAAEGQRVGGPVHLPLQTRRVLYPGGRPPARLGAQLTNQSLEDRVAARVAQGTQLLEHAHGG